MELAKYQKYSMLALRITLGWYFLYAGFSKIIAPAWSAEKYLTAATTFKGFYAWLATPTMLSITNFVNEWGLLLIGLCLVLGVFIKWAGPAGAIMMILYYFPVLTFPTVGHGYIVDEHLIYAAGLLLLAAYHQHDALWFRKFMGRA